MGQAGPPKLWSKGYDIDKEVEKFTVGQDHISDAALIEFDCIASMAHADVLLDAEVLTKSEAAKLKKALKEIGEWQL
jgi:argininosuccinate lyase